jgi:hypothetical protein
MASRPVQHGGCSRPEAQLASAAITPAVAQGAKQAVSLTEISSLTLAAGVQAGPVLAEPAARKGPIEYRRDSPSRSVAGSVAPEGAVQDKARSP